MNSIEAIDYAIRVINRQRVTGDTIAEHDAAMETLIALRDALIDNEQRTREALER